jgi:hypothetical protein
MDEKHVCTDCRHHMDGKCHFGHVPINAPTHRRHLCDMWELEDEVKSRNALRAYLDESINTIRAYLDANTNCSIIRLYGADDPRLQKLMHRKNFHLVVVDDETLTAGEENDV